MKSPSFVKGVGEIRPKLFELNERRIAIAHTSTSDNSWLRRKLCSLTLPLVPWHAQPAWCRSESCLVLDACSSLMHCRFAPGNFFFAGARIFFRSLDAAIFLFSRVARIPEGSVVLPAIETEERITLGAELQDGSFVRGQSEISHPPTTPGTNIPKEWKKNKNK